MQMYGLKHLIIFGLSTVFLINSGCTNRIQRELYKPEQLGKFMQPAEKPFVKLHLRDGGVYLLEKWTSDKTKVSGAGILLNADRDIVAKGNFDVPMSDFVIAETNVISSPSGRSALWIVTGVSIAATIYCAANPKACFGSCPTFYTYDGQRMSLQAEGFSSSVMPSLEAVDVDALYNTKLNNRYLEILVKNEALETHVIRKVNILAVNKPENGRVLSTPDEKFFEVTNFIEPVKALGNEGDISEKICSFDGIERFSVADSHDLSEKEIIELTFRNSDAMRKGLILAFRQTLLTSFLFYQSLAYMGTSVGSYFAEIERNKNFFQTKLKSPGQLLGGIEIYQKDETENWIKCGEFNETGPIASNIQVIPFTTQFNENETNIRLKMAKGMWRIDYASLANIGKEVKPIKIIPDNSIPVEIENENVIALLNDSDKTLVTLPGDEISLFYTLPVDYNNYELFLETQGYYLEWMRNEWLAEENQHKVHELLFNPNKYLKDLTPQFKIIEADMEESFWRSKYVIP